MEDAILSQALDIAESNQMLPVGDGFAELSHIQLGQPVVEFAGVYHV